MRREYTSEAAARPLFTLYDSVKVPSDAAFRVHHHAEPALGYIAEGEGIYEIAGERHPARAGDLFVIRGGEQHCMPAVHTGRLVFINLRIAAGGLWSLLGDYIPAARLRMLIDPRSPVTRRLTGMDARIARLRALAESDAADSRFAARREVLALLLDIAAAQDAPAGEDAVPSHLDDIQRAVRRMEETIAAPLTLGELAAEVNMSRAHFVRVFKQVTGLPPYEYALTRRIEHAMTLLAGSSVPIADIAAACGFVSLSSFNKAFRKIAGIPPREYRSYRNS